MPPLKVLDARRVAALAALVSAVVLPMALAASAPPSPTLHNQAAAYLGWGVALLILARCAHQTPPDAGRSAVSLMLALGLVGCAALASALVGNLPGGIALSGFATIAAAAICVCAGCSMAGSATVRDGVLIAVVANALLSVVIACVQVFAPGWADGEWIARTTTVGRAVGNVRQPNQLATLLLWGAAGLVALIACRDNLLSSRPARVLPWAFMAALMLAVMLSGSRTGMVGVAVLFFWGVIDRHLPWPARMLLLAAPLLYAVAWLGVSAWSGTQGSGAAFGAAQRSGLDNVTTGRVLVWRDALALIASQPWLGVGFGEFNLAWTLTPSVQRWPEFFDHTHNLPLQLLVELGLPLGLLVVGLLCRALWQACARAWALEVGQGAAAHAGAVMLILMGLHSLLEYPLWYAHFLLPIAFIWGLCLGDGASPASAQTRIGWPLAAGGALLVGAFVLLWDYQRVSAIFAPPEDSAPLEQRIANGQRSWFFAHHADYARITTFEETSPPTLADFRRATHFLLDTRLLIAWANAHARAGDIERARWIADRLRELKQPSAAPYFAPCSDPAVIDKPYQCTNASRTFNWRDFK